MQKSILKIMFFLIVSCSVLKSQDCECGEYLQTINLCYFPIDDYCPPGGSCNYNLDAAFMRNGLARKLQNPELFGPNGISKCGIEYRTLSDISSVSQIEEQECNIIFLGVFDDDHFMPSTWLPQETMSSVYDWSRKCSRNLTIATQYEAFTWGYTVESVNLNPNQQDPTNANYPIFNGVFGNVETFQQGGTYQGVFTGFPISGYEILARDALGQPTIILDEATNDLLLGDIGIFCNGQAGAMSTGDNVIFDNDRLTCNIFALGCQIASGILPTNRSFVICEGEEVVVGNGNSYSETGIYIDTLKSSENCDSILITAVAIEQSSTQDYIYQGCKGDGFEIMVGDVLYDENNKEGMEMLFSKNGCDSSVVVNLEFIRQDTTYIQEEICANESFRVGSQTFTTTVIEEVFIPTGEICDSLVILDLFAYPDINVELDAFTIIDINKDFQFDVFDQEGITYAWSPAEAFSCTDCPNPMFLDNNNPEIIILTLTDDNDCSWELFTNVTYICEPFLPNVLSLNPSNRVNREFKVQSLCPLENYNLIVLDRWGGLIFSSSDAEEVWEGRLNNKDVAEGVYMYSVSFLQAGVQKSKNGTITVLK